MLSVIVPGQPEMKPNTAIALLLAGIAGALQQHADMSRVCAVFSVLAALVVLVIGMGTLAEYVLATDLYIDGIFFRLLQQEISGEVYPGRPSPPTALALSLISIALLLFGIRPAASARPSEWLLLCAFFTAFIALVGFAFGAGPLYQLTHAPVIGVAVPTAVSLLLISTGLLLARPHAGFMRIATSTGPGGILFRRLAIPALVAPVLLGPLVIALLSALGVQDFPLIAATLSIAFTSVTLLLLAATALPLNRAHEDLAISRTHTRELLEQAPDGIFLANGAGRYTDVNGAGCRMLGFSREELVGKTVYDLISPEEIERLEREKAALLRGEVVISEWMLRRKDGTYIAVEVSAKILAHDRWQGFVRDIGERRRAREQLRQSQERLELALRGADLATWDWNVKTGEVAFNARWAEMRGFHPEEIKPHVDSWVSGIHPDDQPRVRTVLEDYLQGRLPEYECEFRVRSKSGEWLWVLDRGKVFTRDEHGEPLRMAGTGLDITPRKRLEAELRLALAQSSGILSISADAIICIDEQQRITMFNDGAEKIFGYTKAEAIGAPLEQLIPARFRDIHRGHVQRFAATEGSARRMGTLRTEIVGLRKSGEEFPADASISKLDVRSKTILTVALRDITEQKRIEQEERLLGDFASVLASTLDYETTLDNVARLVARELADICIVETIEEGGSSAHRKVVSRDPVTAAVFEQVPIGRWRLLLGSSDPDSGRPVVLNELGRESLDLLAVDADCRRALRELAPVSLLGVPLPMRGRVIGHLVLINTTAPRRFGANDIHFAEQVAYRAAWAVENARLYRTALSATRARDNLLGVVAHDLRSPLSSIVMQAAVLRHGAGHQREHSQESVERINRAATRMARLIDDLLDVTRMEAGGLSVDRGRVAVRQLICDCLKTLQPLASAASVDLRLDVAQDISDVWGDRDRLLQVLENLISNAVKFTDAGGCISVGATPGVGEVLFRVADTGIGILAEELPHVFDRFWQATDARRRGAGLGLAIVKGLVEAQGGRVWAESVPGRGSTFFFTIPVISGQETASDAGCYRGSSSHHLGS